MLKPKYRITVTYFSGNKNAASAHNQESLYAMLRVALACDMEGVKSVTITNLETPAEEAYRKLKRRYDVD